MLTVTLRSDAASLLLCTVDGPEQIAFDTVADMAGRAPVTSTGEFRDRLTGALVAADLKVNAYGGLDVGAATVDFDRITVGDGDVLTDFPLTVLHQFTREGALKAWETRDRGKGGHSAGFVEGPGKGPRTAAQANAERDRIAKLLADAQDPGPLRARILADLDDNGDGSTVAEFDRIHGDQWTAERQALHNEIINDRLAKANGVPRDSQAVLLGGLPGSGKSNVLTHDDVDVDPARYLTLDPDSIKQELIDRHGIRQVGEMSDGEHAAWLHQESTHIMDRLYAKAKNRGINVIIDKTMSKSPRGDLEELRRAGYSVRGIFVDVSIDESKESVDRRWKEGGRFIPPSYIESSRVEGANSKNVLAFQHAADLFDDWIYVTNNGVAKKNPDTKVRRGSGRFEFAMTGMVVFRSVDEVPRDYHGRWTGPGGDAARSARAEGDIVVDTDNVTVKVGAHAAVELIKDLGTRPTASDLTKVHIAGHPGLFGRVARNTLRRVDMPQIPTDRLDVFADYLAERGIKVTHEFISPLELRATQNELDGRKVGQMITAMQHGTMSTDDKPLWASSDGYILDGHHRWAAEAVLAASGAHRPPMFIIRVGVPMTQLIGQARAFNQVENIDSKHHGLVLHEIHVFTREGAIKAWQTRDRGNTGGTLHPAETSSGRPVLRAGDGADRQTAERQSGLAHNDERPPAGQTPIAETEVEWGARTLTVKVYETGDQWMVRADAYKTGNHAPTPKDLPGGDLDTSDSGGWKAVDVNVWGHGRSFADRVEAMKFRRNLEGVPNGQRVPKFSLATFTREGALKAWETRDRGDGGRHSGVGNGLPGPAELDAMERTGGPLGSQGGGWYRDDNGQRYLVKPAKTRTHAMNELTSALLYKHAGVPVDETGIFQRDGQWFIAKQAIQGPDGKLGRIVGDDITPDLQRQAQDGFGVDALASSWDAYGLVGDNVIVEGGTLHRIDVGGSGMYRAMGGDKASFNPGKEWVEPATLRSSNQGRKLYGNMDDKTAAHQLAKLRDFDVDGFDRKLRAAGVDDVVRQRTVATVRDRIDNQLEQILADLDPALVAAADWLDIGEFTREGAIKAWESRDRGDDVDVGKLTMEDFAKLTPDRRTSTPDQWLAPADEIAAAQARAADKARNVPKPTRAEIAKNRKMLEKAKTSGRAGGELRGNSTTRRERGEALFAEFGGDKNGYCPCGYCGIKVSPKGRGGFASMQQDKILTASEGGKYGTKNSFPNLVPSCGGCNSSRNDEPYHIRPDWEANLAASTEFTREGAIKAWESRDRGDPDHEGDEPFSVAGLPLTDSRSEEFYRQYRGARAVIDELGAGGEKLRDGLAQADFDDDHFPASVRASLKLNEPAAGVTARTAMQIHAVTMHMACAKDQALVRRAVDAALAGSNDATISASLSKLGYTPELGLVVTMQSAWAESSTSPMAVVMQNLTGRSTKHIAADKRLTAEIAKPMRSVMDAQYKLTQSWLTQRRRSNVDLYRGVKNDIDGDTVSANPLSSWSNNAKVAGTFGTTYTARIPADRVFAIPEASGFGNYTEQEYIIYGGDIDVRKA